MVVLEALSRMAIVDSCSHWRHSPGCVDFVRVVPFESIGVVFFRLVTVGKVESVADVQSGH